MKKQLFFSVICLFLIIGFTPNLIGNIIASGNEGTIEISSPEAKSIKFSKIQVNVSALGTFLRADPNQEEGGSPVQEPTIIDLEAEGLNDIQWVSIKYYGEIYYSLEDLSHENKHLNDQNPLIGVFSSTSEIKSIDNLNRVPGAINFGEDYKTGETYFGNLPTDISEDFIIKPILGINIEIPSRAKFLFLCCADVYYPDNAGTIQVTITKLELYQYLFSIENIIIILEVIFIIFVVIFIKKEDQKVKFLTPTQMCLLAEEEEFPKLLKFFCF
jgi:hypothetical protein